MAQTIFTNVPLSGSTTYLPIKVHATATTGTTIHTAQAGTSDFDEVWMWAHNNSVNDAYLTIEYGGTSTDDNIIVLIPSKSGEVLIIPGLKLQNSLVITAFCPSADVIFISGYVNRSS